jgi:hypothetical protein
MDIAQSRPKIAAWQIVTGSSKNNPCQTQNPEKSSQKCRE